MRFKAFSSKIRRAKLILISQTFNLKYAIIKQCKNSSNCHQQSQNLQRCKLFLRLWIKLRRVAMTYSLQQRSTNLRFSFRLRSQILQMLEPNLHRYSVKNSIFKSNSRTDPSWQIPSLKLNSQIASNNPCNVPCWIRKCSLTSRGRIWLKNIICVRKMKK